MQIHAGRVRRDVARVRCVSLFLFPYFLGRIERLVSVMQSVTTLNITSMRRCKVQRRRCDESMLISIDFRYQVYMNCVAAVVFD